jgi:hypothetical protein
MKNASFAAMQLMMAATACGLRTLPMEGFDERRLQAALSIPEEYAIPVVICVGHSMNTKDPLRKLAETGGFEPGATQDTNRTPELPAKVRFPLQDVCYVDQFGKAALFDW